MKGQIATEHIMMIVLVMIILIPGVILYVRYSSQSSDTISSVKADAIANEIVRAANEVYSYGLGSQTVIEVDLPTSIDYIEFGNNEVVFHIVGGSGEDIVVAKVADVDMEIGAFSPDAFGFNDNEVLAPGKRQLIIRYEEATQKVSVTVRPICGNGVKEIGEGCDTTDFGVGSILCNVYDPVRYSGGNLDCLADCSIDFQYCVIIP